MSCLIEGTGSDVLVWGQICLARHIVVVGYLDMVKDEKLAIRSCACHGPRMLALDRKSRDGGRGGHCCQTYFASQQKDVAGHGWQQIREPHGYLRRAK